MSSIADMVNFAFRKKIFNWLKKCCCSPRGDVFVFSLYEHKDPDTKDTKELRVYFNKVNEVYQLSFRILCNTEDYIYLWDSEDDFSHIIREDYNDLKLTSLAIEFSRFKRHFITNRKCCDECKMPFGFESEILGINSNKGNLIDNYCQNCEEFYLPKLDNKLIEGEYKMEEIYCDVCYEKCIEKIDDKIKLTLLTIPTCCKGKYMCNECRQKQNGKCFFCRQAPKWEWLL